MKAKSNKPSHDVVLISDADDPETWIKIGSAWEHQDGQGLNLRLDLLPSSSHQRLAIRPRDANASTHYHEQTHSQAMFALLHEQADDMADWLIDHVEGFGHGCRPWSALLTLVSPLVSRQAGLPAYTRNDDIDY